MSNRNIVTADESTVLIGRKNEGGHFDYAPIHQMTIARGDRLTQKRKMELAEQYDADYIIVATKWHTGTRRSYGISFSSGTYWRMYTLANGKFQHTHSNTTTNR